MRVFCATIPVLTSVRDLYAHDPTLIDPVKYHPDRCHWFINVLNTNRHSQASYYALINLGLMLAQHRRRWVRIRPALAECIAFAGTVLGILTIPSLVDRRTPRPKKSRKNAMFFSELLWLSLRWTQKMYSYRPTCFIFSFLVLYKINNKKDNLQRIF